MVRQAAGHLGQCAGSPVPRGARPAESARGAGSTAIGAAVPLRAGVESRMGLVELDKATGREPSFQDGVGVGTVASSHDTSDEAAA